VTNAVLHSGAGDEDVLELNVDLSGDRLRVTVIDHGSGFEPPQPTGGDESGWGLYIVDRLSHQWGVDRAEKTSVWFEMQAGGEPVREPAPAEQEGTVRDDDPEPRTRAFARLRAKPTTA
jgi:anti-sigma regulatory factor (Ser/Thr protein kinase)